MSRAIIGWVSFVNGKQHPTLTPTAAPAAVTTTIHQKKYTTTTTEPTHLRLQNNASTNNTAPLPPPTTTTTTTTTTTKTIAAAGATPPHTLTSSQRHSMLIGASVTPTGDSCFFAFSPASSSFRSALGFVRGSCRVLRWCAPQKIYIVRSTRLL